MIDLKKLTDDVCKIARECGAFLKEERRGFSLDRVESKHSHDYVSYVDRESEKRLVKQLGALLPEAGFITEEGTTAPYSNEQYCWVIDPLDGTTNYIHNNAPYCVSIALRTKTELLVGVVYEVCRDECFSAYRGGGAWLNGERITVSGVKNADQALVVVELPYNVDAYRETALHFINSLYGRVSAIRMNGSAATAICYVAAGRFDVWGEAFIGRWDFSAGALIVTEAGGCVTDAYGSADYLESHHIVASNGHLHQTFLDLYAEAMPKGM